MLLGTRVRDLETAQQNMAVLLSFSCCLYSTLRLELILLFKFAFSIHCLLVVEPQSTKEKMVYANVS